MDYVIGGASTYSRQPGKRPTLFGKEHPDYGIGCYEYFESERVISYPMGQHGPPFGFRPRWLVDRMASLLTSGKAESLSYAPCVENEVAEILCGLPGVESVRFGKNGGDVCAAAVRLARAVTGRDKVLSFGYHGAAAEFCHEPQGRGVPQLLKDLVYWFAWGDRTIWERSQECAAIIVEVPPTDDAEETQEYLRFLKSLAASSGCLFILDEVVTGFRLDFGGAAEYYNVVPDLYCWGKAMSNGFAVSALGGKRELMQEFQNGVFFSGTFFDDPLGLSAAKWTLGKLRDERTSVYAHLWEMGLELKRGFNIFAEQFGIDARCVGQAPRTVFEFADNSVRSNFNMECLKRGVLFDRPQFISTAHTEEIVKQSLDVIEQAMGELGDH